jgi:Flp pilus assembly pilin Flp
MVFVRRFAALKLLTSRAHESGQTFVEYGLIISLIAIAAILGITMVAGGVNSLWNWIGSEVTNAVNSVLT